ncbi:MAG: DNA polymerase III subunit gamma/tau, partial [Deltaproteobacteria bacterium]|nr:DNA polymerase III subunit gamma/tau [Deltaproteobacteria bacterium]MBW1957185.1 DNA polymerase III subunit gamma/tau [Deltaproteobacteria bacterium]MBW2012385.1 DNA polymerase III subunit gamma/tau [Deltaproteobacteria bacterium]MBW2319524.1 DNA polymerase III subunit gamma/tau [Deltaproteobacteria bacterium]
MSYLVLARKYRPQTFDQVIKQDHVTRTLTNAISAGRVAHAILFSGPRGTGKTTVARILAKAMNCKDGPVPVPCNECKSCREITAGSAVDVFEIDGASNNSVDQIRELRENVKYMPAHSLYKIYIIDEVHMLSIAAFNALLKTLEEPPPHVMFVFATTEPRKIPITILSRCQRHDFRRIDVESISKHMEELCAKEGVEIAVDSLGLIAREAGGSMRDGLSLLDHVMSCTQGAITHEHVLDILGVIDRKIIFNLSEAILRGETPEVLNILDEIYNAGHDMKKLYGDLIEHFRNLLVVKMVGKIDRLVDIPSHEIDAMRDQIKEVSRTFLNQILDLLFKEEVSILNSTQPRLAIEMVFIKMFQMKPAVPIDVLIAKLDNLRKDIHENRTCFRDTENKPVFKDNQKGLKETSGERSGTAESIKPFSSSALDPNENIDRIWERLLAIFSEKYPSLAANLKNSTIRSLVGHHLEIEVNGNDFNINMVRRNKNSAIIKKVCSDFFGKEMEVIISAKKIQHLDNQNKTDHAERVKQEALSHPLVTDTLDIFNGNIVDVKIL